jgi:hypothetical protein
MIKEGVKSAGFLSSGWSGVLAESVYAHRLRLKMKHGSSLLNTWAWIRDAVTYETRSDGSRGNILSYDEKYAVSIGMHQMYTHCV